MTNKIKEKIMLDISWGLDYNRVENMSKVIDLTIAKMNKESSKVIDELMFKGRFKGIDEETDRAYQKGNNDVLKELKQKLEIK